MKRQAAHKVIIDGVHYTNHVVEIEDGKLLRHYPLSEELPNTEWVETILYAK